MRRKPGLEDNGRETIALPTKEMRVLTVLLDGTADEELRTDIVARRAGITYNPNCAYVVLRRLRDRGLIKTTHFRALSVHGNNCLFAKHELTAGGRKIASAWARFLRDIGPAMRRQIGW